MGAGEGKRGCVRGGGGSALGSRDHKQEQSRGSVPGNVACYNGMRGMPECHVSLQEEG